ncbi:MAG TPA: GNAT family N-acetyltransferase [Bacteriovoracaceae bacterium]|nr:GNAT family N-acetyltransferase [Bacteriovoracaceae bacterium]
MNTTGKGLVFTPDSEQFSHVMIMDSNYFPRPWDDKSWLDLNLKTNTLMGWERRGDLVGFALFGTAPSDDTAHLFKILIKPEFQGSHISQEFWTFIVSELKLRNFTSIFLEVEASNERAQRFYQKVGFKDLRIIKSFYSDGEDAHMMQLML